MPSNPIKFIGSGGFYFANTGIPRIPDRRKTGKKPGAGLIILSSRRSAQLSASPGLLKAAKTPPGLEATGRFRGASRSTPQSDRGHDWAA